MISKTKIKTKCKTPIEQIKSVDTITSRIPININSYISADIPISDHVYDIERYPSGILTGNSIKLLRGKFSILPEVTR